MPGVKRGAWESGRVARGLKRGPVAQKRYRTISAGKPTGSGLFGGLILIVSVLVASCSDPAGIGPEAATPPPSGPPPAASVAVIADVAEMGVGEQVQLEALILDGSGNELTDVEVTWSSNDPSVASVDGDGVVTGLALGSLTVSATAAGASGTLALDVNGFLIGPSGGEVLSADGRAAATVPADALTQPVVITIEPAEIGDLPTRSDEVFVQGSAYEFGPSGQQFSAPVELRIQYDPARIPQNVEEETLGLGRKSGEFWTGVTGGSVDMSTDEVRGEVMGFSIYASIGVPTDDLPAAAITAPAGGSSYAWGSSVTFTGTGTDPEDGALSGAALVWTSSLDGQFGTGGSVMTSALSIGVHTITLTVTDSNGGVDTDQITVTIT